MDYEDLENYTLMTMLDEDDDDRADNTHLDNKFTLVNHNVLQAEHHAMEDDEKKGFSVFCDQTIRTCADTLGMSLDGLSANELNHIADDISHHAMNVIKDCKILLTLSKQSKLTCKMLENILLENYGFRCYGEEVRQFYEMDKNEEESIQKKCEKQFVQLGNSKIKKLYINNEYIYNCMDVEVISYNYAPFYITQKWLNPAEEYLNNSYTHLDHEFYNSIINIVLSDLNIPFIKLVNEFDINRVALKLINCIQMVVKVFVNNDVLGRLFDFFIALANSQYLLSPAYTRMCLNLLKMAVAISTKEFICVDQALPLGYSMRTKAASLVADMVNHWDMGPKYIMIVTHGVNKSIPTYKELLSYSGAVHILSALGRETFKHSVFFCISEFIFHMSRIHELYMSRMQGSREDRRILQRFHQDSNYVRDALFSAMYQLYKNNFLDTTSHLYRQSCLNGDLLASRYIYDLALMIRHDHYNTPFTSSSLYLYNPSLVVDVDAYDEDGNEITTEIEKVRKRDKDKEDLNALVHLSVTPVPRTKNYNCFDNEVIGPILSKFNKVHLHLSYKDRQLLVDDIYYRCMHNLLQAQMALASGGENEFKLQLSNLRTSLYMYYPSHFVKSHAKLDVYSEFEDYKPIPKHPRPKFASKIEINITKSPGIKCMQKPEFKLKRCLPINRNLLYHYEYDDIKLMAKYRHQIFCRRKFIHDLKFDYKKHACSSLLSVML